MADIGMNVGAVGDLAGDAAGASSRRRKKQVDKYIPHKCSWTHKLLPASDRGSVIINIAKLDDKGHAKRKANGDVTYTRTYNEKIPHSTKQQ